MLGWFKHKITGKLHLLDVKSVVCIGYGPAFTAVHVKSNTFVETGWFGDYYPIGIPVKQPFPKH
jgi:hypothetical protein